MAGYILGRPYSEDNIFHVGDEGLLDKIRAANGWRRVILLQLDQTEMDAALWGLSNFGDELRLASGELGKARDTIKVQADAIEFAGNINKELRDRIKELEQGTTDDRLTIADLRNQIHELRHGTDPT